MSIIVSYNKELGILTGKVSGYLTIEEYKINAEKIISSDEYPSDVNTIWDLNEMRFDNIDLEFEQKLIAIREQSDALRGKARVALVSDYALGEPMIKLFKILSKSLMQEVESFQTIEEAQAWLLK